MLNYDHGKKLINEASNYRKILEKVRSNMQKVIDSQLCSSCDGCGYDNGCNDTECGFYQANKSIYIINEVLDERE